MQASCSFLYTPAGPAVLCFSCRGVLFEFASSCCGVSYHCCTVVQGFRTQGLWLVVHLPAQHKLLWKQRLIECKAEVSCVHLGTKHFGQILIR